MKYLFVLCFVYIAIPLYSQEKKQYNESYECVIDDYFEFPKGDKALRRFLEKNLNATILNSTGEKGKVMVELKIRSSGKIKSVTCNPDYIPYKNLIRNKKIEKEITRVMNMMPKLKIMGDSNKKIIRSIIIPIQIPFHKNKKKKASNKT